MAGYTPTVLQRRLSLEHRLRDLRQLGRAETAAVPAHHPFPRSPAARFLLVGYHRM